MNWFVISVKQSIITHLEGIVCSRFDVFLAGIKNVHARLLF